MNRLAQRVVLVAWPGAEWSTVSALVDRGLLPHVQQLVENGLVAPLQAPAPQIGPSLYTSAVTGVRADRHGILASSECDPRTGSLRAPLSTSRNCKALWNILGEYGLRSVVVGWPVQYPAEAIPGVSVTAEAFDAVGLPGTQWAPPPDTVFPASVAVRLKELCLHPTELTAAEILPFLPDLPSIDQKRDSRVRILSSRLARIISTHAVTTALMESEPWDFLAVAYGLIESASGHAVESAYRFSDKMLGRLLQLSGEDSLFILMSASGFRSSRGFFCMAGPGVKKDEFLHGATLFDIAPTVAFALGCPVARDPNGVPLTTAFVQPAHPEFVRSWERATLAEHTGAQKWISQLEALGYRDPRADQIARNSARLNRERALNLATVYVNTGRLSKAAIVLERLRLEDADDETSLLALVFVHVLRKRYDLCRALLRTAEVTRPMRPILAALQAFLAAVEANRKEALSFLKQAESGQALFPLLFYVIGSLYLRLGKCQKAEAAFRRAAELDPSYWPAEQGRAAAFHRLGRLREAAEAVRASLNLNFSVPESHSLLAVTLLGLGDHARAVDAFRRARAFSRVPVLC